MKSIHNACYYNKIHSSNEHHMTLSFLTLAPAARHVHALVADPI